MLTRSSLAYFFLSFGIAGLFLMTHDGRGGVFLKQWAVLIGSNKIWNDRSPMITNTSFYFPNSVSCVLLISLSRSYQKL